jgi:hypothetical protein
MSEPLTVGSCSAAPREFPLHAAMPKANVTDKAVLSLLMATPSDATKFSFFAA